MYTIVFIQHLLINCFEHRTQYAQFMYASTVNCSEEEINRPMKCTLICQIFQIKYLCVFAILYCYFILTMPSSFNSKFIYDSFKSPFTFFTLHPFFIHQISELHSNSNQKLNWAICYYY